MKKKSNIIGAAFIILLLFIVFNLCRDLFKNRIPEGHVVVHQATVDSLRAYIAIADSLEKLAHLPPDTIEIRDTIYLDTTQVAETTPHQTAIDTSTTRYSDSLKNNEIDVSIQFDVVGHLSSKIKWEYKPVIVESTVTIEKPVPYPVIETVEVKVPKQVNGHYISAALGGNDNLFNFGVDYDFVTGSKIYGLQYRRYGDINVYGVKIGVNLSTLFKK